MFFPSIFVCLALVLLSFCRESLQAALQARRLHAGLNFDDNCAAYQQDFTKAIAQARLIAKSGYRQARDRAIPLWPYLFKPDDRDYVMLVMKNAIKMLNGKSPPVRISCSWDTECDKPDNAGVFMYWFDDPSEDYINFCPETLTGPQPWPADQDYCEFNSRKHITLANVLLHEMMHLLQISNGTRIEDWADLVEDCARLVKGKRLDDEGNLIQPIQNANSFVYLGELAFWEATKVDPQKCPQTWQANVNSNKQLLAQAASKNQAAAAAAGSTTGGSSGGGNNNNNNNNPYAAGYLTSPGAHHGELRRLLELENNGTNITDAIAADLNSGDDEALINGTNDAFPDFTWDTWLYIYGQVDLDPGNKTAAAGNNQTEIEGGIVKAHNSTAAAETEVRGKPIVDDFFHHS